MSLITLTRVIDDGDGDPMDAIYTWCEDLPASAVEERLRARHAGIERRGTALTQTYTDPATGYAVCETWEVCE